MFISKALTLSNFFGRCWENILYLAEYICLLWLEMTPKRTVKLNQTDEVVGCKKQNNESEDAEYGFKIFSWGKKMQRTIWPFMGFVNPL